MARLDILIFGATGFTGKHAVEETVRISKKYNLSWGVAGRSQTKMEELLVEVGKKTGVDLSQIKIVIADVASEESLKAMAESAKVVANCCGPYRRYGEPVVRACMAAKTHQVDVSGEPEYIESMQLEYAAQARDAGVYIVSACGFDSVPNDMGVVYLEQNFRGVLNSVESYLSTDIPSEHWMEAFTSGSIHYGTWDSLVHSLASWSSLGPLRKKLYPERLPSFKPKLAARPAIHRRNGNYCIPFPGADNSIVYRTQRHLYEETNTRPVQFKAYLQMSSLLSTIVLVFTAAMVYCMCMTEFTRKLLLKYPRLFSMGMVTHDGPKEEVMNSTKFTFELYGEGWAEGEDVDSSPPNKKMVARVRGVNPGYGATVTALMYAAVTVLKEQDKMPKPGGVLTTGAAFKNTNFIQNLCENNFTFEIVKD